jgi:KDO2-lipid IV(A) lauroyltransferase
MRYLQNQNTLMQFIVFAITYPIIWMLSRLPMRVLYIKSDILYFLVFYVFRYRKQVVLDNLKLAFPKKNEEALLIIRKKFFKHLIDLMMESIKSFSISKKEISKRYTYVNPELVNTYAKEGRSIALVGAHQANWEWSVNLPLVLDIDVFAAYTRFSNTYFEKIVRESRGQFGGIAYRTTDTVREMQKNFSDKKQGVYILLSDQSPQPNKAIYWRKFFNIKVPVHTGAEMLAKKFDFVVINYVTRKIKRGYYETEFKLITDTPKELEKFEITDLYTTLTEQNITEQPEYYLWSHKRFKHSDKVPIKFQ